MNEKHILQQLDITRSSLLKEVEDIEEKEADQIQDGFPNSIRWQLGHVYLSTEFLVFKKAGESTNIPENYGSFFGGGTHPNQWEATPPELSELKELLKDQKKRLLSTFEGKMDNALEEAFQPGPFNIESVGAMLLFSATHESEHIGWIKSMKRAVRS